MSNLDNYSTASRPTTIYRSDIDGLRALAVLLVLVFHFHLLPLGDAGFIGVDVFFVISGYLITGILLSQLELGSFRLGSFYTHRIRRLAPALLATLVLVVLAGYWLFLPEDLQQLMRQMMASQSYVANVYFWRTVNYFGLSASQSPLLHMWSLAVEEQFYLLYPLMLVLLYRWLGMRRLGWALFVLALLSFILNIWMVRLKPEATFYLLPTRAWELLAGALLHWAMPRLYTSRHLSEFLGWTGLGLIFIPLFLHRPNTQVPGFFVLWPVLGAACLILAGVEKKPQMHSPATVSRLLAWAPVVFIGRISYPAYLVHWPIHVFASKILGEGYTLPWRWVMFIASLLLASVILFAIENPVRRGSLLSENRRVLRVYVLSLLLGLGIWGLSEITRGLPQRFASETVRLSAFVDDRPLLMPECEQAPPIDLGKGTCRIGSNITAPTWLIIGDSHAWALHPALVIWLNQRGESAVFSFQHGCPPVMGIYLLNIRGERCFRFNQDITRVALAQPSLRSVLLISTWLQAPEGKLGLHQDAAPADSVTAFSRQFTATVNWWHEQQRQVYVWEPLPGATRSVPQAMALAHKDGLPAPYPALAWTRQDYDTRYRFFFDSLKSVRPLLAASVSPAEAICGDTAQATCSFEQGGMPLYYDNNHPSSSSAALWAKLLGHSIPISDQ